ncbi:hypothetical protein ACHAWF_018289 [Thalassiosira exigua]
MTVAPADDPEIPLGLAGPAEPSAPPAVATAVATPVAATSTPAATTTTDGGIVERSLNADGSLAVTITRTSPRPNGYRELTVERFHIPAGVAGTVGLSLDHGDPPSTLYMTRMEQQLLPPGTGPVVGRPPSNPPLPVPPGYAPVASDLATPPVATPTALEGSSSSSDGIGGCRACGICCAIACAVIVVAGIIRGATGSQVNHSAPHYGAPSWPRPSPPAHEWTPRPAFSPARTPSPAFSPVFTCPYWRDPVPMSSPHCQAMGDIDPCCVPDDGVPSASPSAAPAASAPTDRPASPPSPAAVAPTVKAQKLKVAEKRDNDAIEAA